MTDAHSLVSELPQIDTNNLPEEEKPHAGVVWFGLHNLATSSEYFADALALFDHCSHEGPQFQAHHDAQLYGLKGMERIDTLSKLKPLRDAIAQRTRWTELAGRDGSISLWNFLCALRAVKTGLDAAKSIRGTVEMRPIDAAISALHKTLPNIELLRNAVAHRSELTKNPDEIERNAADPMDKTSLRTAGGGMVSGFDGRTFFLNTHEGKVVEYELSSDTLDFIVGLTRKVYGAF